MGTLNPPVMSDRPVVDVGAIRHISFAPAKARQVGKERFMRRFLWERRALVAMNSGDYRPLCEAVFVDWTSTLALALLWAGAFLFG